MENENEEENLVVEDETTENVGEQATEEVVNSENENSSEGELDDDIQDVFEEKKYTEKELNDRVDELLKRKISRRESKIRDEYKKKYSKLENVLSAGLGTNDIDEMTNNLSSYYESQGVNIPEQKHYSDREEQILAKAEADEIINSGYEDIVEELDRLADIGVDKMSTREKLIFKNLEEERKKLADEKELLSIGADVKVLNDEKYKNFIKDNGLETVSSKKAYELYQKLQPKPQVEKIGDLTNNNQKKDDDFISEEQYNKMTEAEIEKNLKTIRKSMFKW